jgi:hypothetical protein
MRGKRGHSACRVQGASFFSGSDASAKEAAGGREIYPDSLGKALT